MKPLTPHHNLQEEINKCVDRIKEAQDLMMAPKTTVPCPPSPKTNSTYRYESPTDAIFMQQSDGTWKFMSPGSLGDLKGRKILGISQQVAMSGLNAWLPQDISDPADNSSSIIFSDLRRRTGLEHCTYMGKRVRLISKNYQDGTAIIEDRDITGPFTLTVKLADCVLESPNDGNKCSCGHDSLAPGNQGKHSNWCDKFFKY